MLLKHENRMIGHVPAAKVIATSSIFDWALWHQRITAPYVVSRRVMMKVTWMKRPNMVKGMTN